jgi:hypothetical protein
MKKSTNKKDKIDPTLEDVEHVSPETKENHRKQLVFILILVGFLFGILAVGYLVYTSMTSFEYQGSKFTKINYGELQMYHVVFPLYQSVTGQHVADFNLYLRNDPRTLERISVPDNFQLTRTLVLTGDADKILCEDNGIAFGNLANAFKNIWQVPLVANTTLKCDPKATNGATYLILKESNVSSIEKTGNYCYTLNINNCEVLNVTERFILESMAKANGYS